MATFIHSELSSYASLPSLKRDFRPSTAPINTTPTTGIAQGTKLSAKVPYHSKAKCKQFYFGYILVQQSGLCFPPRSMVCQKKANCGRLKGCTGRLK